MRFLVLLLLTSCATIIQGEEQVVQVNLIGAKSAECELTGNRASQNFTAPAEITVGRSHMKASIACQAAGQTGSVDIVADVSDWGYGGAALGNIFGASIDSYTGAAFEYPEVIEIEMGTHKVLGKNAMNDDWLSGEE